PFANDARNVAPVLLVRKGDRGLLQNRAFTAQIPEKAIEIRTRGVPASSVSENQRSRAHAQEPQNPVAQQREALTPFADRFGFSPAEVDKAVQNAPPLTASGRASYAFLRGNLRLAENEFLAAIEEGKQKLERFRAQTEEYKR